MFRQTVVIAFIISLQVFVSAFDEPNSEDDRIVAGRNVTIEMIPYQASLQKWNQHFCGGSLLNEQYVLTAAHCLEKTSSQDIKDFRVVLGTTNYASGGQRMEVASFAMHPWYNNKTFVFDIGLIKLKKPVTFSSKIQPIVMAETAPENLAGCIVSGWGYVNQSIFVPSPNLQAADVNFYRTEACYQAPNEYPPSFIQKSMVCAGADGRGSCQGDSGGPLMEVESKLLVGVVSWGFDCAQKGHPTVYANVPYLKKWVETIMDRMRKA